MLDALDECDPTKRDELLKPIVKIVNDATNLVTILISSRQEQDIMLELERYPNLAINADKDSIDVAAFVAAETNRLVLKKKLLQYSKNKVEMKQIIVSRVI